MPESCPNFASLIFEEKSSVMHMGSYFQNNYS